MVTDVSLVPVASAGQLDPDAGFELVFVDDVGVEQRFVDDVLVSDRYLAITATDNSEATCAGP